MSSDQKHPPIPFQAPEGMLSDGISVFKDLLRIDTTNPPGNEVIAADQCVAWLNEVGISSKVHDAAPGRRSLVATLGPDDGEALILSAHLDVVPADPEHWDHPPFDAVEADGCIWGRGAIDMKHMAAYGLAIMRDLARSKAKLKRGLKLVLVADEEAGCEFGSLSLARTHPEWLHGSVAITEVGGFTMYVDGARVYPVQVAEKGFVWLRLTVAGTPGHGSMPSRENALVQMADIIDQLADQPFPFRRTQPVQDFLTAIGDVLGFPKGAIFKSIGNRALSNLVLEKVVKEPKKVQVFQALLRDTTAPTIASGGKKTNVIPGEAELTVDCRILPGTDPEAFVREFKERVRGDYTVEVLGSGPPVVMDKDHPMFGSIVQILHEADPGCHPVPQMISGFTDARAFAELGIPCFGFSPVWLPEDINFAAMFHGHNERIPVEGFRWGLACLWELVRRSCV